jgi:hypothetical protein
LSLYERETNMDTYIPYAHKYIKSGHTDLEALAAFEREARICAERIRFHGLNDSLMRVRMDAWSCTHPKLSNILRQCLDHGYGQTSVQFGDNLNASSM